ncbi:abortive infection system toxin AbiGii family protein [Virgibacillus ainsalahensis]
MFANFEKAFFKNNEIEEKLPEEVIKSLSEQLPDGFAYTSIGSKAVGVTVQNSPELKVGGLKFVLPEDLPKDFKPSTTNEILEYIYRTQQKLRLKPDENKNITINETKFKIDDMIKYPLEEKEFENIEMYAVPEPFRSPFKITLYGDGVSKDLFIQRQPYKDMHKSLFKNIDNNGLVIIYIVDEIENEIQFRFDLNIEDAKNVQEAIESLKLYYSCLRGTIKVNDYPLPKIDVDDSEIESIFETIKFWEKVIKVEETLSLKFTPKAQIMVSDVTIIEELYRSFVEKKPYKEYVDINSFSLEGHEGMDIKDLLETKGLMINFIISSEIEVFDEVYNLHSVVCYFDFRITDVKSVNQNKTKFVLTIQPFKDRKIYQSTIHFKSEEDAKSYQTNSFDINELQHAETLETGF